MGKMANLETLLAAWFLCCRIISSSHVDVILLGGTGDLAQKYLWQSFFDLYSKHARDDFTFGFYGCGRRDSSVGGPILKEILAKNVKCMDADVSCQSKLAAFLDIVTYRRLKIDDDYQEFGEVLKLNEPADDIEQTDYNSPMNGVIFYVSIPPTAYMSVTERLHRHCYPKSTRTWTRVVLEKPFGRDYDSASEIAATLSRYFREDEIYRIDHYLGKSLVRQIIPFRSLNRDVLEEHLSRDYVERVEIVMKETIGVEGRVEFYDENGVIRDVFQNHLTELLTVVAMDLPFDIKSANDTENAKSKLLGQIRPVTKKSLLTGQYAGYLQEARMEKENISESIYTPTFGASLLFVDNARWWGVPFLLYSGKQLDERSSYVRILFRNNLVCVNKCKEENTSASTEPKQIIFQIGGGQLPYSAILVTRSLFDPVWPDDMQSVVVSSNINIHGLIPQNLYISTPRYDNSAYTTLIEDIYRGDRRDFVSTDHLLKQWKIWNDVLDETENDHPRIYENDEDKTLDFLVKEDSLEFYRPPIYNTHDEIFVQEKTSDLFIPSTYLGQNLVCLDTSPLNSALSSRISASAHVALNERGVFHLALSGGRSPIKFFKVLAENIPSYIWSSVHIWQVDERCVSLDDKQSNFQTIDHELLNRIRIPFVNVHPMPVDILGRYCDRSDRGDERYENTIRHKIPTLQLDYILLGLGDDGHVASIFPFSDIINEDIRIVSYTNTSGAKPIERMSILFPLINRAREVAVLVTGKNKNKILKTLENVGGDRNTHPVKGVNPLSGNFTWYIDRAAWLGL